jgi:hypothetical protein
MKTKKAAKTKTKTKPKVATKAKPGTKKQQTKKIIVASLAVGVAGILSYFGWQYLKKKKAASNTTDIDSLLKSTVNTNAILNYDPPVTDTPRPKTKAKTISSSLYTGNDAGNSGFPLKKGSKGDLVKQMQDALIAKYGKSILPKYGADGDFGTETVNALKKVGLPVTIDQSTFNVVTAVTKVDMSAVGRDLYQAAKTVDFNKAIASLGKLKTTEDYSAANAVFKSFDLKTPNTSSAVRQTIVNGLLNTFSTASQKDKIKYEFLRMGLQFDGSKWSLSGLDGLPSLPKNQLPYG